MAAKSKASQSAAEPTMVTSPYSFESFISFINNNFAIILIVGLFFIGGFFTGSIWTERELLKGGGLATAPSAPTAGAPAAPTGQPEKVPEVTDADHVRGNRNAKVVLVEYSDFECPFCGRFHPTTQQVLDEYGDDVALVYRHYPLSFHPNAQKAAEGSECVAKQGGDTAFWKYADALFEVTQADGKLTPQAIQDAAGTAGVNMTTFNTCLDSGEMATVVKEQMTGGSTAGVTGTPGTIIVTKDGGQELIPGALPYEQVAATIDRYL